MISRSQSILLSDSETSKNLPQTLKNESQVGKLGLKSSQLKSVFTPDLQDLYNTAEQALLKGFLIAFVCAYLEEILKNKEVDPTAIKGLSIVLKIVLKVYSGSDFYKSILSPAVSLLLTQLFKIDQQFANPLTMAITSASDFVINPMSTVVGTSANVVSGFVGAELAKRLYQVNFFPMYKKANKIKENSSIVIKEPQTSPKVTLS